MMLAAGDVPGGPTEGITYEQLQDGPVRLNVPDPDIPFLAQIEDLEPFPPVSLPAPIEKTEVFVPTRPHRVLQGRGPVPRNWASRS